jgi:hypothetical protein
MSDRCFRKNINWFDNTTFWGAKRKALAKVGAFLCALLKLNWLESRTCGINQSVSGSSPDLGAATVKGFSK